ncbi:hypothetical protein KUL25_03165 [Rhodobacteraceae bacterium N5(2021)]|uniref:Uncharacterized protein n=1 Tax=Gymnodinialimonas phycosphaerae TaxID=2841589 RepID=A0A975TWM8_9RHOB|nr:hypothetical protein [Gymnodinialimonas phycosphaerae]MBY4891763.1 hypothetical protein [Gymnodinialimonas phycosphaerae]
MKSTLSVALCLSATQLAASEPVRLCNVASYGNGSPVVEIVLADDRVIVGLGQEDGGGDLVTLREPGRFVQTWARLSPGLAGLPMTMDTMPGADTLFDMLDVRFADGTGGRWVGTGPDNPIFEVIAAFGMNDTREFFDRTLVQVDADHPIFADPCGDWP